MERRQLLIAGVAAGATALASSCGNRTTGAEGGGKESAAKLEPSAASMKTRARQLWEAVGKPPVGGVIVNSSALKLMVPGKIVMDADRNEVRLNYEQLWTMLKPVASPDALPFDTLATAVGTGSWSGSIVLMGGTTLVGGKGKTFLDDAEVTAPESFLSDTGFPVMWDQALALGGRQFSALQVTAEKAQVMFPSQAALLMTTKPCQSGLIDPFHVSTAQVTPQPMAIPDAVDGKSMAGALTEAMKAKNMGWKDLPSLEGMSISNRNANITDRPALVANPNESDRQIVAMVDPADRAKVKNSKSS